MSQQETAKHTVDEQEHGDEVLVARMAARDEDALRELIQKYSVKLYPVARRAIGSSATAEDIEEVLSDTFLRAWNLSSTYDALKSSVTTWLSALLVYQCLTRRHQLSRATRNTKALVSILEDAEENSGTDTTLGTTHSGLRLQKALDILHRASPADADIVVRRFYKSQSPTDIARQMGITSNLVRVRLYRALRKPRNILLTVE